MVRRLALVAWQVQAAFDRFLDRHGWLHINDYQDSTATRIAGWLYEKAGQP